MALWSKTHLSAYESTQRSACSEKKKIGKKVAAENRQ